MGDNDKKPRWPPKPKRMASRIDVPPGMTPVIESPGAIVSRPNGPQAQINYIGLSTWYLILASIPGIAALIAVLMFSNQENANIGTIAATATNAKDIATMAERNAKLAQYQLEETLKRHNLEVPHE